MAKPLSPKIKWILAADYPSRNVPAGMAATEIGKFAQDSEAKDWAYEKHMQGYIVEAKTNPNITPAIFIPSGKILAWTEGLYLTETDLNKPLVEGSRKV